MKLYAHMGTHYGFCGGVRRAINKINLVLESPPKGKVYLLNELIHNPAVNQEFKRKGVIYLNEQLKENESESNGLIRLIKPEDVVIVPAFGNLF